MKVTVYDYTTGQEQKLPTRYVDEVVESYCTGTESELDAEFTRATNELTQTGRYWLNQYILLMR